MKRKDQRLSIESLEAALNEAKVRKLRGVAERIAIWLVIMMMRLMMMMMMMGMELRDANNLLECRRLPS